MSQSGDRLKQLEEIEKVRQICVFFPLLSNILAPLIKQHGLHLKLSFSLSAVIVTLQDIVKVIRSAGETLEELSKDAPSEDRINSTATKFLKSLEVKLQCSS